MIETRIFIKQAGDLGVHPRLLFGRLQDNELVFVLSSEGKSWHRRRDESAECFEARIVQCLLEQARRAESQTVLV